MDRRKVKQTVRQWPRRFVRIKRSVKPHPSLWILLFVLALGNVVPSPAAEKQVLQGYLPTAVAKLKLQPIGGLPATTNLTLAIGLPVRNSAGLAQLLKQIYDPASPNYRHYLTPVEFTERFGPTKEDYQTVMDFAKSSGLTVIRTHPNRMLLEVMGSVADIQKALHVTLHVYHHPKEKRTFYAPDVEPSIPLGVPILDITGLDNYTVPHPANLKSVPAQKTANMLPASGSSPYGTYMGNDFRAAYAPDVSLDGAGQRIGLLQFDDYYDGDIVQYENAAGLPSVPLRRVTQGIVFCPCAANDEVALDIEMVISMAPGLSEVIVYEAGFFATPNGILNQMANDNLAKQLSSSWAWGGGPNATTQQILQQMAAQGQSFFEASGDSGAYSDGGADAYAPQSSPYATVVGGTRLTTSGSGGSWASETTWPSSSGGVSSYYSIPSWQQDISMSLNQGSTSMRNIPDVALTAEDIYLIANNGQQMSAAGTSAAVPLWAGFAALINQQAEAGGQPTVGFINPAIYAIGKGACYSSTFHDITTGDNGSSTHYPAVSGYDLCTGWGTPNGSALINSFFGSPAVTVGVSPTGIGLTVLLDGLSYTDSHTFSWECGSSHTLEAPLVKTGDDGKLYGFQGWSDGNTDSPRIVNPTANTQYTAFYTNSSATLLSLTSVADTYVHEARPTDNYGSVNAIVVDSGEGGHGQVIGMFKFDLSGIPSGSTVDYVNLQLTLWDSASICATRFSVGKLLEGWSESTVTWNTKPQGETYLFFGTPDALVLAYDSNTVPALIDTVQAWVNNPGQNYGFDAWAWGGTHDIWFCSREYSDSTKRPKLVISYRPPPAPVPPSNLSATTVSLNQINLTWKDNSSNETGFKIERSTDNSNFNQINTVGAGVTSYHDTGRNCSTTYYYRVRAYNSGGNSGYSNTTHARTKECVPSAPSNLQASAVSSSQINLTWKDNSSNETGFKIERSTDNIYFGQFDTVGAGVTSYQDAGLDPCTTYYHRVRAYNLSGDSDYSNTANAKTTCIGSLQVFIIPQCAIDGGAKWQVDGGSWQASGSTIFGLPTGQYIVHFSALPTGTSPSDLLVTIDNGQTTITNGTYSQSIAPTPPSNLTATPVSPMQINLSWQDNSDIETGFKIERAESADGPWMQIAQVSPNTINFWNTGLFPSKEYHYRVRAYNCAGDSDYCDQASAGTPVFCPTSVVHWGNAVMPPDGLTNVVAIAPGDSHSLALKSDGTVVEWGDYWCGEGGAPTLLDGLSNVVAIAASDYHSLALKSDGTIIGWGCDGEWQRADLSNVVAIAAGDYYYLALKSDGTVDGGGQEIPPGLFGVVAISAGGGHSLALKGDGTVIGWGYNEDGQATGVPTTSWPYTDSGTVVIDGEVLSNAVAIAGGGSHSLALKSDGSVVAWGDDYYGQTDVPPCLANVVAIAAGGNRSLAIVCVPNPCILNAPSALTATAASSSQIELTWQDNSDNETGFVIESADSPDGPWYEYDRVDSNSTSYSDVLVGCNWTYYYRVRAFNEVSSSPYSNIASANTSTVDTDGDGIPDCWMLQYFGHETGLESDKSRASDDASGTGQNNLFKYVAGLDPTNPASVFLMNILVDPPSLGGVLLDEQFSSDVFASGSWTRTDSSVTVETVAGLLHIASGGGYNDGADKVIHIDLSPSTPIVIEQRLKLESGGSNYRLPWEVIYFEDSYELAVSYAPTGWFFGSGTDNYNHAVPGENYWAVSRIVVTSTGGELFVKPDDTANGWFSDDFSSVASMNWSHSSIEKIEFSQPLDASCDIDYITIRNLGLTNRLAAIQFSPVASGRTYTPEFSTNLTIGNWSPLTGYAGPVTNANQVTITDTNAIESQKFYRIDISLP